eukprot:TRINITY_DN749_c0_g1_i9.p1 TRINITY_DN749_c0_g1~~TRINITY_DN749_c0_g1_i9.p1  ORF type:complete len:726 (+),score=174.05 TRINITY_DN749_c0_g1_i9:62-2239(+)
MKMFAASRISSHGLFTLVLAVVADAGSRTGATASNPVTKVVTLLQELKTRIDTENMQDQDAFDKYACWCEKTTKTKADAITDARTSLSSLGNTILQLKGAVATTVSEIKGLIGEIKANEETQQSLAEVRQKENAAFEAEKSELVQASSALEQAILVLKSATGGASLLGIRGTGSDKLLMALHAVRTAAAHLPASKQARAGRHLVALDAATQISGRRYTPQSATIQGILSDMYDTFTTTLESVTKEEARRQRNFESLMHTMQETLQTLQETLAKKERAKAESETMLADATQDFAGTEAQLVADVEVFDSTKQSCEEKTQEWSTRKSLRATELSGITQAITVLTSDEAREVFGKAIQPGFAAPTLLQIRLLGATSTLGHAFESLVQQARRIHSDRLAEVALAVRDSQAGGGVGHFDKVLEAIDSMTAMLQQEGKTDTQEADHCTEFFHNTTLEKEDIGWKIKKNDAHIEKLGETIAAQETELTSVEEKIIAVQADINETEDARNESHHRFLEAKRDDEKAIALLQQASTLLVEYYEQHGFNVNGSKASLLRVLEPNRTLEALPKAEFSDKGSQSLDAKGIVSMLAMIIDDLQAETKLAIKTEEADQLDFERRTAALRKLKEELNKRKIDLDGSIALRNQDKSEEKSLKQENQNDLLAVESTESSTKPRCDWLLAHLMERRTKRAQEAEALSVARAFLAGARPELLETAAGQQKESVRSSRRFRAVRL